MIPLEEPESTDSLTHENGQQTLTDIMGEERAHERQVQNQYNFHNRVGPGVK